MAVYRRGADCGRGGSASGGSGETAAKRGRKKRAKTDRIDARLLRTLLWEDRLPEAAIPPAHVLEVRTLGWLCAVIIWAEIGDVRRFTSSQQLVRYAGLDVTVYSSDRKRSAGQLSRQGSPELRWAMFEAAKLGDAGMALPVCEDHAA